MEPLKRKQADALRSNLLQVPFYPVPRRMEGCPAELWPRPDAEFTSGWSSTPSVSKPSGTPENVALTLCQCAHRGTATPGCSSNTGRRPQLPTEQHRASYGLASPNLPLPALTIFFLCNTRRLAIHPQTHLHSPPLYLCSSVPPPNASPWPPCCLHLGLPPPPFI